MPTSGHFGERLQSHTHNNMQCHTFWRGAVSHQMNDQSQRAHSDASSTVEVLLYRAYKLQEGCISASIATVRHLGRAIGLSDRTFGSIL